MHPPAFLLDENVDVGVVPFLEKRGCDVSRSPKGLKNGAVAALARKESRTLITIDRDYTNTDIFRPSDYHGIIVLAVHPPRLPNLIEALERLFFSVELADISGKLFIVRKEGIEIEE